MKTCKPLSHREFLEACERSIDRYIKKVNALTDVYGYRIVDKMAEEEKLRIETEMERIDHED